MTRFVVALSVSLHSRVGFVLIVSTQDLQTVLFIQHLLELVFNVLDLYLFIAVNCHKECAFYELLNRQDVCQCCDYRSVIIDYDVNVAESARVLHWFS